MSMAMSGKPEVHGCRGRMVELSQHPNYDPRGSAGTAPYHEASRRCEAAWQRPSARTQEASSGPDGGATCVKSRRALRFVMSR